MFSARFSFKNYDMRFFISGAVSMLDYDEACENFNSVEEKLRRCGVEQIYNPIKEIGKDTDWKKALDICLKELEKCDAIILQHNWKHSAGARHEFTKANKLKLQIFYDSPNDYRFLSTMLS